MLYLMIFRQEVTSVQAHQNVNKETQSLQSPYPWCENCYSDRKVTHRLMRSHKLIFKDWDFMTVPIKRKNLNLDHITGCE